MNRAAHWLRRLRSLLWTAFSIVVIFAAILVGIGKLLMPYSDHYKPQLESWLSDEFGYPVRVESFSGQWRAFGPRLILQGLRIQPQAGRTSADEMLIAEAALDLKPLNLLLPGKTFYSFLVIGADLQLVRDKEGQLHLSGLGLNSQSDPGSGSRPASGSGLSKLVGVGELRLEDSRLDLIDEHLSARLHLSSINALLQVVDEQLAVRLDSSLSDESNGREFGTVRLVAKAGWQEGDGLQNASWQMSLAGLSLEQLGEHVSAHPMLPRQGTVEAELWGQWAKGGAVSNRGTVEINNSWLSNGTTDLVLDRISSQFSWYMSGPKAWQLDLHDTLIRQAGSLVQLPGLAIARDVEKNLGLWFGADYLPLQTTLPIARDFMALLNVDWPESLPETVGGNLSAFDLVLAADWSSRGLSGTFRDVSISEWQRWPALSGLNGQVLLQSGQGELTLSAPALQVDWPEMFGYSFQLSLPECRIELQLGLQWQIFLQACHLFNDDLSAQGDVLIAASPGRPAVDVNVEVLRLDAGKLNPYWPEGIMPETVTDWLRTNLQAGQLGRGRLQIHGDMDDWPFSNGEGRFEAWATIENGLLSFVPDWPTLQGGDVIARFIGAGMWVEGQAKSFGGVVVPKASASIESFSKARLQVDFQGQEKVTDVLKLLQQTPVLPVQEVDLSGFEFGGTVSLNGKLELPLGKTPGSLQLSGKAQLKKGSFLDQSSAVLVDAVEGPIRFDQQGLDAEGLQARYKGKPAKLDLQVGGDTQWGLQATLNGQFAVADLVPEFLLEQEGIMSRISGDSEWRAQVLVPVKAERPLLPVLLKVDSDMRGIRLDFPEPLAKAVYEVWPVSVSYPLTGETRLLQVELNRQLFVAAEIAADSLTPAVLPAVRRATVSLGSNRSQLPVAGSIQLGGKTGRFNLDGWVNMVVGAVRSGGGLGGLVLDQFVIEADELVFLDRLFEQTRLSAEVSGSDIRADFEAENLAGHLLFTTGSTGRNSLNAEFERLVLGKPLSGGMETQSDPSELPELHLYARSFRYLGLELGETRIEAYPTSDGFHFETVEANSKSLGVRASGDWTLSDQGQRSDFDILMTAESLGDLLQSLDISSSLQGGQTVLKFDAWWPGSPAAFALANLNGAIEFSVTRGQITNASSGTGKVLGLLSIQSLPRRLSLDFRDVFDSGFGFETATGTFNMENGTATTDDVKLTSSAANIELSGSTDLVKQQYDQQMTVMPGVGNTLPVIGALAAGPGGAAAGLALQGLLHEQLGKATQVQYTIKGSWDEPLIEPVVKDAGQAKEQPKEQPEEQPGENETP